METDLYKQIFEMAKKASRILVALPEKPSFDAVASALALAGFFGAEKKEVEVVCAGGLDPRLEFLPGSEKVVSKIRAYESLVLELNTEETELEELSYQSEGKKLKIFLQGKNGIFRPEDIKFSQDRFPIDLIFVLEATSLADLGEVFFRNAEVFHNTPKASLFHGTGSENFAQVNLVSLTATSIAEILTDMFKAYEKSLLDEKIATCLLAGIVSKTESFQHPRTTPAAFLAASELVGHGADQQEVVRRLFKNKPYSLLKLWGLLLAKLQTDETQKTGRIFLLPDELKQTGAGFEDIPSALKELVANVSECKFFAVLVQKESGVLVFFALPEALREETVFAEMGKPQDVRLLGAGGLRLWVFEFDDMSQADIQNKIEKVLQKSKV